MPHSHSVNGRSRCTDLAGCCRYHGGAGGKPRRICRACSRCAMSRLSVRLLKAYSPPCLRLVIPWSWIKVQMLWCSLESVFTGGDIAKQMSMEAKKFSRIDKDWDRIMKKSYEVKRVTEVCANDNLRSSLPVGTANLRSARGLQSVDYLVPFQ